MEVVDNNLVKQMILQRIQDRLHRFVSVKDEIENTFTNWFQGLLVAGQLAQMPPPPANPDEGAA